MKHTGTKIIETDRLILRPFVMDDAQNAYKNWMSEDKVTKYLRWQTHKDISETKKVLEEWTEAYNRQDTYLGAIVLKEIDEPVGSISVVDKDEYLNILHVGYCIGSKWWNKGITSESYTAVIDYLFREVRANRIESQHDPDNPYSGRVMRKCGLQYEGTLRKADFNNQGVVDACMYSILREEWNNLGN